MLHKRLMAAGAALVMVTLLAAPASAHGGHHSKAPRTAVPTCTVCTAEGCAMIGRHIHDGVTYCGSHHANGVCDGSCVSACTVEDCTTAGRHVHDGAAYCGSHHANGVCDGSCVGVCTAENCATAGRHVHDGITYCGSDHATGICDGSCAAVTPPAPAGGHHGHGHHGCH